MKTFAQFLHESQIVHENNLFSYTSCSMNEDGSTTYLNVVTKFPIGNESFESFIPANSVLYSLTVHPNNSVSIVKHPLYPPILVSSSQMAASALFYDKSVYQKWETETQEIINKIKALRHEDILALRDMTFSDNSPISTIHKFLFDTVLSGEI